MSVNSIWPFLPPGSKSAQLCCTAPSFPHSFSKYPFTAFFHQVYQVYLASCCSPGWELLEKVFLYGVKIPQYLFKLNAHFSAKKQLGHKGDGFFSHLNACYPISFPQLFLENLLKHKRKTDFT